MPITTSSPSTDFDNLNNLLSSEVKIYSSRESIRSQLTEYAQEYLQLAEVDLYKTSFLSYVIDMLSILSANQLFYSSMIYKEFFFVEAQLQESVYNLARWIGYTPRKAIPSTVDVMFSIPLKFANPDVAFGIPSDFTATADGVPFLINSYAGAKYGAEFKKLDEVASVAGGTSAIARIVNNNAITVRTTDGTYRPIYLSDSGDSVSFLLPFTQQEIKVEQFIIPKNLEFYQFYSKDIEYDGQDTQVKVWVKEPKFDETLTIDDESVYKLDENGIYDYDPDINNGGSEWTEAEHGLYTMTSSSTQFSWFSTEGKGELFFGNGVIGRQPKPGSKVLVLVYVTKGEDGNVISNSVTTGPRIYYQDLKGESNTTGLYTVNYNVINPSPSEGGQNAPSLPEVKNNAIVNLRSKERLVAAVDYDDINEIMGPEYPVSEAYPILKRSDLKTNEIMVFNRLLYHDADDQPEIVPTRNARLCMTSPVVSNGKFTIPRRTIVDIDGTDYETIFTVIGDTTNKTAAYDYVANQLFDSPAIKDTTESYYTSEYTSYSYIPVSTVDYVIDFPPTRIEDLPAAATTSSSSSSGVVASTFPLTVTAKVTHIPSIEVIEFRAYLSPKWGEDVELAMTPVLASEGVDVGDAVILDLYESFTYEFDDYQDVPTGLQRFQFTIEGYVSVKDSENNQIYVTAENAAEYPSFTIGDPVFQWETLERYYSDVIIRQELEDIMMSSLSYTRFKDDVCVDATWVVHNVPVILKSYLDEGDGIHGVMNRDNQRNFEQIAIQKLLNNVEINTRRMLTDYINVKFCDTIGTMNNLKYNTVNYEIASRFVTPFGTTGSGVGDFDDTSSSSGLLVDVGTKYIVNNEVPGYEDTDIREYINFIARYTDSGDWELIQPIRNTYARILDETSGGRNRVLIFNGTEWIDSETLQIPIQLYARIKKSPISTLSNAALVQACKTALMEYFMNLFGIHKVLDRSEIISVMRAVSGVEYVDLIDPSVDIVFDYDLQDLTEEELLDYTPQYTGFVEDSISIDVIT